MWTPLSGRIGGWILLSVLIAVSDVAAQQFTGGIRGTVRDTQGVIPGVTVTLTDEATSLARETVTNEVGEYNFVALPPATYTLRTTVTGYRTFERRGIRVGTQQFFTIDVMLEVGAIEEAITVTADAPLIETSNASVGDVLDREALATLPSPGRNVYIMSVAMPTVANTSEPRWNRQQDQLQASLISLGGGGIRANNYLLDGVPVTDLMNKAVLNASIEALEDVKVQVHTYDAEMGRTGGGVFNATGRSGTNTFHGTGFFQTRPVWGLAQDLFSERRGESKEDSGLSETYYRLWGGGFGGPIVQNRTFFWTSVEGYRTHSPQTSAELWPSARQRAGDFSTTTLGGQPVRIFNPWCRGGVPNAQCPATGTGSIATGGEFVGAVIPRDHQAANPVAFNMAALWPQPLQSNEDSEPNARQSLPVIDKGDMWTLKATHRFTDAWTLSGLYVINRTNEPGGQPMVNVGEEFRFLDPSATELRRKPQVLVFNNTNILDDTTVLTLRYGWSTFPDGWRCKGAGGEGCFDAGLASLGFDGTFIDAADPSALNLFPRVNFENFDNAGATLGNAPVTWGSPFAINAAFSKLMGSHTLKIGADARELNVTTTLEEGTAGSFSFQGDFTSGPGGVGGYDFASFLLGIPNSGSMPVTRGEGKYFVRYYGAYVQDDWRVNSNLTLNYGLRFEHEDGMREAQNRITVGFDPEATSPELQAIEARARASGYAGPPLRGGLVFAGVNGAPVEQGDLPALKLSPRVGAAWVLDDRTVVRGGYGLFWAPWQYTQTNHGTTGFTRTTQMAQSSAESEVPLTTLDNPFPNGLEPISGSALGILTGLGGDVNFIDQNKGAPYVHQYSVDYQRELPGDMAITVGYTGATGRDLGFGGTGDEQININQIDPSTLPRDASGRWEAAALRESVPNPFFGVAGMGELGTRPTIQAGQLLRPFPQFGDLNQFQTTEGGRRQYHALVFKLDKRTASGWGGRFSYTWGQTKDNQWGQTVSSGGSVETTPQNYYDLDAEYSHSIFDVPHRIVLAPIVRLPGPSEASGWHWLLGNWTASAIVELRSGAPATAYVESRSAQNLGLFGGLQRPNLTGTPIGTSGSDGDRVASAGQEDARWFNRDAFADPGPGQYGNAPRTNPDARFQFYKNVDVVFTKAIPMAAGQDAELRFEVLNATNTHHFRVWNTNVNLPTYGRVSREMGFPRVVQFSFRYNF